MYIRRFTTDPGLEVLLNIESVNVLDIEPEAPITSTGYGTVLLIGEFEKGPYNTPTEVFGPSDVAQTFGGFGFSYGGVPAGNPCARKRLADATVVPEYWNGNGMVALNGKTFSRLILTRVDTSVGSVSFSRSASILGNVQSTFAVTAGQTLIVDVGGGNVTSTILGTQGTYTGGVFPGGGGNSGFIGGEWLDVAWDAHATVRVYFLAADQTPTQVAARINGYVGYTMMTTAAGGTKLVFTGVQYGSGANVNVVAADAPGTLTAIGIATGTHAGTGSAVNLNSMTVAELHTLVHAAVPAVTVDVGYGGAIRMTNTLTPLTGTLKIVSTSTAVAFGFAPLDTVVTAVTGSAQTIPAGTRVRTAGAIEWVTCDDVAVTAASAGPYSIKVRPSTDDGTAVSALANAVTTMYDPTQYDNFSVTNPLPLTQALTETQLDVAYLAAFDTTYDVNSVVKQTNTSYCARQSNAVRRKGRDNADYASKNGCYGRRFCMRPPFNTLRAVAKQVAEPGIQAYRHERVIYCYPGASVYMPAIAAVGTAGGAGFTADGFINEGADGFMAMACSLLPPAENPGQVVDFFDAISGLEDSANVQGWDMTDYISFKAYGIAALRMDGGTPEFQSGVTSVDPVAHPGQVTINRRRLADQLEDTLALRAKNYGKKLGTRARYAAMLTVINDYLSGLTRIESSGVQAFVVDGKKGNTAATLAAGLRWIYVYVQTVTSMDSIVLQCEISPNAITVKAA